jgi:mycothiol system anti-sigma-R factor
MSSSPKEHVDCRAAIQQLWDYLDEELTDQRMEAVRHHLEKCRSCLPYHESGKALLDALAATRDTSCCAPESLRRKLTEALRAAGFTGRETRT